MREKTTTVASQDMAEYIRTVWGYFWQWHLNIRWKESQTESCYQQLGYQVESHTNGTRNDVRQSKKEVAFDCEQEKEKRKMLIIVILR